MTARSPNRKYIEDDCASQHSPCLSCPSPAPHVQRERPGQGPSTCFLSQVFLPHPCIILHKHVSIPKSNFFEGLLVSWLSELISPCHHRGGSINKRQEAGVSPGESEVEETFCFRPHFMHCFSYIFTTLWLKSKHTVKRKTFVTVPSAPKTSESFLRSVSFPFCRDSRNCFTGRTTAMFFYCTMWPETDKTLKLTFGLS